MNMVNDWLPSITGGIFGAFIAIILCMILNNYLLYFACFLMGAVFGAGGLFIFAIQLNRKRKKEKESGSSSGGLKKVV